MIKSRGYMVLLIFGAIVGIPAAVIAYFFLQAVTAGKQYFFTTLPGQLGFSGVPAWWPLPMLALCGLLVGLTLRYLPGTGGHLPAEGFKTGGIITARDLPSIIFASLATLILGAVLGPETPVVLIGAGIAVLIVHLVKKDAPQQAVLVIGAAGSFAAISTLLINPLVGAFMLLEAAGIGGGMISVVLAPGLVAAGIGALIFVGLDKLTGFGTFSLAIGGLAIIFAEITGKGTDQVLFSGETALAPLIQQAATWSVGALVLLIICKGLAYGISLSSFRGGPTFPGMFLGAAAGIALSHLPGLPLIDGVGIGIGAMTVVMLGGLPLTAALLTLVLLQADAINLISVVIVAVAVAWVASARLSHWLPQPAPAPAPAPAAAPSTS
jgi:H+/Cl- antiporter ClcA